MVRSVLLILIALILLSFTCYCDNCPTESLDCFDPSFNCSFIPNTCINVTCCCIPHFSVTSNCSDCDPVWTGDDCMGCTNTLLKSPACIECNKSEMLLPPLCVKCIDSSLNPPLCACNSTCVANGGCYERNQKCVCRDGFTGDSCSQCTNPLQTYPDCSEPELQWCNRM